MARVVVGETGEGFGQQGGDRSFPVGRQSLDLLEQIFWEAQSDVLGFHHEKQCSTKDRGDGASRFAAVYRLPSTVYRLICGVGLTAGEGRVAMGPLCGRLLSTVLIAEAVSPPR